MSETKYELNYYEKEHGKISLMNMINIYNAHMILCNNIIDVEDELEWEDYSLIYDEENDTYNDIYQYYIIRDVDKDLFIKLDYPVAYSNLLDVWIVGITHWGTGWDYVLTDIPIEDYKHWFE